MHSSPHILKPASVSSVMTKVLIALLPGIAAYVWFFGAAILVQIAIASVDRAGGEAVMLAPARQAGAAYSSATAARSSPPG